MVTDSARTLHPHRTRPRVETPSYSDVQRREYLLMRDRVAHNWLGIFHDNEEYHAVVYWNLFTNMWKQGGSIKITDVLRYIRGVNSLQTVNKYVENAVSDGFVYIEENPLDKRSKLITLTNELRERLDYFFDMAIAELKVSNNEIYRYLLICMNNRGERFMWLKIIQEYYLNRR